MQFIQQEQSKLSKCLSIIQQIKINSPNLYILCLGLHHVKEQYCNYHKIKIIL